MARIASRRCSLLKAAQIVVRGFLHSLIEIKLIFVQNP